MLANDLLQTRIFTQMVPRMQRTHERRRASFFVGPPGIGKSTAIAGFAAMSDGDVMVTRITKRGVTGPQALGLLLNALRDRAGNKANYSGHGASALLHNIHVELEKACDHRRRDERPELFPKLTIVFDEAQRLTNGAIDALRDWNEPHYFCAGPFPIGMIFVGNNELSLQTGRDGTSILDEGMQDRLLYREQLTYEHVDRSDMEDFARSRGITDDDAVNAIGAAFAGPRTQRSFRRLADFIDLLFDEAGDEPLTRETVRTVLSLS